MPVDDDEFCSVCGEQLDVCDCDGDDEDEEEEEECVGTAGEA